MGGQLQREGAEGGREPGPAGAEPYSPRSQVGLTFGARHLSLARVPSQARYLVFKSCIPFLKGRWGMVVPRIVYTSGPTKPGSASLWVGL